ncbi:single stranded DNA-binding domain-containing protein [Ruegeria lacuscaerulensis]|uniref:nucleotide-binding protein n=1 Tax=Ruegeria lacuscaerulensis TaxID=55218 RepID=UPI00147C15FF|nr:nucleotide-binding protein [Ruegeria lacuscaerulensis]
MPIIHKLMSVLALVLVLALPAGAGEISPREAIQHLGDSATVVGVVSQVSNSGKGTTFINFGGRYPNHVFYAVIFRSHGHKFPSVYALEGNTVAISGTIELYKGKPQIILSSPDQVQVR